MNKRGSEDKLFFLMWELLAFAMVLIIILISVRGVVNNSTYWKTYYSTDLALMTDIENINQGDFIMNYALKDTMDNFWTKVYFIEDKAFEISLTQDRIEVYDYPKEDSKYPTTFPFAKNKNINIINQTSTLNFLILSKIRSELKISDYVIEEAEICPSYDTSKDTDFTIFETISLDAKIKAHSESIKAILSRYGKGANAINESKIFIGHAQNFTIYYSDDAHTMQSQKLACMIKMKYLDTYTNSTIIPELKKYDGSLDFNADFKTYSSQTSGSQYWIIIMISDEELKIKQNDFAMIVDDAIVEYYK